MTICSSGLNLEAVKSALYNDFAYWKIDNEDKVSQLDDEDRVDVYMKDTYAMSPGEGNILETIKEMNSPPMDEKEKQRSMIALTNNIVSCSKRNSTKANATWSRKKRSDEGMLEKTKGLCSNERPVWQQVGGGKYFFYYEPY